jgi:hypothetical protein
MDCGKRFGIADYREELDERIWEMISLQSCNRA